MHTSAVMLRPGNILEIAKDVVRPSGWNCEWNVSSPQKPSPCKITLSSWDSYMKVCVSPFFCSYFSMAYYFFCMRNVDNILMLGGNGVWHYSSLDIRHGLIDHIWRAFLAPHITFILAIDDWPTSFFLAFM